MDHGARIPGWAAPYVTEGRCDERFAALFDGPRGDHGWALACLALARLESSTVSERLVLYRRIATRQRRALLSELAGRAISDSAVRVLRNVDATTFERDDWRSLIEIVARDADSRMLGHVPHLTAGLIRQYEAIPVALRLPRLLECAAVARVATARWRDLAETLDRMPADSRSSLERRARAVKDVAGLWDYLFFCRHLLEDRSPFPVESPELGPLFHSLSTAEAMRREGGEMRNCMARCVRDVLDGNAVYYRWNGKESADVELLRPHGDKWTPGMIAGTANTPISASTKNFILDALRTSLGERLLEENSKVDFDPSPAPGVLRAQAVGRKEFTPTEVGRVADVLRQIRGRSAANDNGAFCILEMPNGLYAQFLARIDRPWLWVEVCSHRYNSLVGAYLNEETVTFLDECHFRWPPHVANFGRSLPARSDADCEHAATFALGALRILFRHATGLPLAVSMHIPLDLGAATTQ